MYRVDSQTTHQARSLIALYEITQLLTCRSNPSDLLAGILKILENTLELRRGIIMMVSPNGEGLSLIAAQDLAEQAILAQYYRRGQGVTGRVLATGEAAIIPDVREEKSFLGLVHRRSSKLHREGFAFVCVPIILDDEVIGTLSVDHDLADIDHLTEVKRMLEVVAGLIGNEVRTQRIQQLQQEAFDEEKLRLRSKLGEISRPDNIMGNSKGMQDVYLRIQQVAASTSNVLIRGESGTGKELVAQAIHFASPRANKSLVKVNCAALNENLLESELFGHEKGAFTGALYTRRGRLEEAEGGTIFLDEIGEFSPAIQIKLLRVLQEREYERVGSNQTRKADVRMLAATNRNLEDAVKRGEFRDDLFYRINVFPIHIPPLRERRDDILILANYFVKKLSERMRKPINRISTPAINMLMAYHWPGNVRELENCIEYSMLLSTDGVLHGHHMPPTLQVPEASPTGRSKSLAQQVANLEHEMIVDALKLTGGNITAAAKELDITPRIIRYKVQKLNIDYEKFFHNKETTQGK